MIIKEYRIPMPLGTDEYRIAQLYMIAKKSKLESEGEASGVEIVTNEPYTNGPGGNGQYTDKLYHIEAHLPYWLRGFLPKALAIVREEAWNAYPYSKNSIYMPNMDKLNISIESKYLIGGANQENVFQLSENELSQRCVDVIDFVAEDLTGKDYLEEEDPILFTSKKTSRGPLIKDWLMQYNEDKGQKTNEDSSSSKDFMCVYKICRVKFEQWGLQTRVEQFIHDYMRKQILRAHRQAWAWQDEWYGLTMEQIREMEREVQEGLAKLMASKSQS